MQPSFDSAYDILTYAHQREEEAALFYGMLATIPRFQHHRQLLLTLQQQERDHQKKVEAMLMNEPAFTTLPRISTASLIDPMEYLITNDLHEDTTLAEVLRLALKREQESHALYRSLARESSAVDTREIFLKLAGEEKSHSGSVDMIYRSLYHNSDKTEE